MRIREEDQSDSAKGLAVVKFVAAEDLSVPHDADFARHSHVQHFQLGEIFDRAVVDVHKLTFIRKHFTELSFCCFA